MAVTGWSLVDDAQQFVDSDLGARGLADGFDDDGRIQAVTTAVARQAAGDDDGAGGYRTVADFVGFTIVDRRRGADEHAHGDDCAATDVDAFDDFRAGADKAVILDDARCPM